MGPAKPRNAQKTRARILEASAQLFSVKGYGGTTIEDVLARTGLTKGGLYAHFTSKEDLCRAVIEHATAVWVERVLSPIAGVADPRDQLRALFDAYRAYAAERAFEGGCFFVNLSVELDDQHDEFRGLIEERFEQFRAAVAAIVQAGKAMGAFREDTPEAALAAVVVSHLTGTMMQAKAAQDFGIFDAANRFMIDLIAPFEGGR